MEDALDATNRALIDALREDGRPTKYRPDFSPIDPDIRPVTRPTGGDSTRARILELVRYDGRMTNQEIASQLDLSETSVRRHVRAMIEGQRIDPRLYVVGVHEA